MLNAGITSSSSLTPSLHSISESTGDWNHFRSRTQKACTILVELRESLKRKSRQSLIRQFQAEAVEITLSFVDSSLPLELVVGLVL